MQIGHLVHFDSCNISYHKHDYLEFAFAAGGKFSATVNGKSYVVKKGEIIVYSPNIMHMEEPYENSAAEIYFLAVDNVFFKNHGKNYIIDPADCPVINTGNLFSQLNMQLMELLIETNSCNFLRTEYIETLAKLVLINILRLLKKEQNEVLVNDRIKEIAAYIDKNFAKDIDLDFLAASASYSKFYFSRLFKEYTGLSPIKYLQNKRLEESKKLLENTNDSIDRVAQKSGFQSLPYYCQLFKKSFGATPSDYRTASRRKS